MFCVGYHASVRCQCSRLFHKSWKSMIVCKFDHCIFVLCLSYDEVCYYCNVNIDFDLSSNELMIHLVHMSCYIYVYFLLSMCNVEHFDTRSFYESPPYQQMLLCISDYIMTITMVIFTGVHFSILYTYKLYLSGEPLYISSSHSSRLQLKQKVVKYTNKFNILYSASTKWYNYMYMINIVLVIYSVMSEINIVKYNFKNMNG